MRLHNFWNWIEFVVCLDKSFVSSLEVSSLAGKIIPLFGVLVDRRRGLAFWGRNYTEMPPQSPEGKLARNHNSGMFPNCRINDRSMKAVSISCCGQQMWNGRKQEASSEVRGWLGNVQDRKLYFKQNLLRKSSPWKPLLGKFLRIVKCILCLGWWNSLLIQLKTNPEENSVN